MTTDYVPIDCDQHSVLEVLALRRAPVRVDAIDDDGERVIRTGRVMDVRTRARAEYLVIADDQGGEHEIRLDRLITIFDDVQNLLWRQKNGAS